MSRVIRSVSATLAGVVAVGLLALAPGATAAASTAATTSHRSDAGKQEPSAVFRSSSYLCYGYQDCKGKGMGNAGYAAANDHMYWRMYAGHNCTNYAAYRMVHSGLPDERPWSGGGNAMYWGTSMPRITDDTPRVGAVAWWKANTGPAGSVGHVAYVERVVSADEVVVSQDSWGGDFSWAVITRASGNWPSGFIHFNDVPLTNTAAPAVDGVAKVGSTLSATPGTWRPGAVDVAYQWYADGQPISGATAATYKATRAVLGEQVSVTTTASKLGYPTRSASSAATEAVLPGMLQNTVPPTITGDPTVDQALTVQTGTWNPAPRQLVVQWLADGQPIDVPADTRELTVPPALVGARITATVTASRDGYDDVTSTTAPTEPVARATFTVTDSPVVTGTPRLGEVLTATLGDAQPAATGTTVQWLRDGEPVEGADSASYQLTNLDLGHRLSVVVTRTRDGYVDATTTSAASGEVTTVPIVRVRLERSPRHWVRVTVAVTAPGLDEVEGPVVVRIAGVAKETVLRHGTATVTLWKLPPGDRTLTVRYAGSDTVDRARLSRTVRVR